MKLYSFSPTPNNRKVEAFIKHFELPVEIHSMGFKEQENRTEAYRQMNPMGKAPLLVDGDFHLWESNAILCYIATLHPETGMLPADPQGRAEGIPSTTIWADNRTAQPSVSRMMPSSPLEKYQQQTLPPPPVVPFEP